MNTLNDIILKHKGKRICVMGGAETLESDLMQIEADIFISVNGHGHGLQKADYYMAMDEHNRNVDKPMSEYLKSLSDAPIISPRAYADYQLSDYPQCPRDVLSGMIATWVAMMLGAKVVILAGMNGYQDKNYIFEATKIARDIAVPVRVMSDELSTVWQKYDANEKFGKYTKPSVIDTWLGVEGEITIECVKPTTINGNLLKKGDTLKIMRHQVLSLLKHKMIKEV